MRLAPTLALALALAAPAAAPSAAQDFDVAVPPDAISVDPAAKPMHRKGRRLVSGEVLLERPIVDGGRVIDRMSVMQEWDCKAKRYRVARKTFRTQDGQFVHSDPRDGPWTPVVPGGPGWRLFQQACPASAATAAPAPAPAKPRRPQVVAFPQR